ncbi:MAG: alkaline phosphatase D family protein, partial [Pyrinomonadaceae bacterium]|nr:alkaline phosphatase D family protein [Pyrinomonadaceae bacterium]
MGYGFILGNLSWNALNTQVETAIRKDVATGAGATVTTQTFPNAVASGDTTRDSTVLWARSSVPGRVIFVVFPKTISRPLLRFASAEVTDTSVPAKVEITKLRPGTNYSYVVIAPNGERVRGSFTTAHAPGSFAGLRFGVSGDSRGELGPYPAISNADERNLNFFVELGDTIYADVTSPAVLKPQADTREEFRAKHNEVYTSRFGLNTWGDLRASTSVFSTIDDHEVTNDFAGGAPPSSDPRFAGFPGAFINDTPLYEDGLQAFQEYNPIRAEFYGDTGDERTSGERKLYRARTYGNDAAVLMLDARSFRDQELISPNPTNPADIARFILQSFDFNPATGQPTGTRRTMLGSQQLQDLKNDLLEAQTSGVTWKFVMVPEPIQNLGLVGASDRFEGYAAERTDLLRFIDQNGIQNVVFVAADVHGTVV